MKLFPRFFDHIVSSETLRYFFTRFLQSIYSNEYEKVEKYLIRSSEQSKIILNCREPYQFEHLKEIYFLARDDHRFFPIPISTRKNFLNKENKTFDFFEKNYGLSLNNNYFPYFWLPKIQCELFIEVAVSTYSNLVTSGMKVLYAHGLSSLGFSKDAKHIKLADKYDYLFLTGPLQKKALVLASKRYGGRLPELVEIGFLRGDRLITKMYDFDKSACLKKMGADNKFTVLFAPTWGEFSATEEWIDKVVETCNALEVNLLIRLHPLMFKGKTKWARGIVNWSEKLSDIVRKNSRVYLADNDNVDEYLLCADTLITDASSIGIEFMILKKPAIFLPCSRFFELFGDEKPIYWLRKGKEVSNMEELRKVINKIITGEYEIHHEDDIIYNPGKALQAISQFLDNTFN